MEKPYRSTTIITVTNTIKTVSQAIQRPTASLTPSIILAMFRKIFTRYVSNMLVPF